MFREMQRADIDAVCEIVNQHSDSDWVEEVRDHLSDDLGGENHIALVKTDADGVVRAFSVGVVYESEKPEKEYGIRNPTFGEYPEGQLLLLKLNYVDSEFQSRGIGSEMIRERIGIGIEKFGIDGVFCEAWVKPVKKSSDELLEKIGFTQTYSSQDYWEGDDVDYDGDWSCDGCDSRLKDCSCAGAIYVHDCPESILEE